MNHVIVSNFPDVDCGPHLQRGDAENAEDARRIPLRSAAPLRSPRLRGVGRFLERRFGFLSVCVILAISLAQPALAQSADKILKQSIKIMTIGDSEKALRRVTSWQAAGSVTRSRDGATGRFQMSAMRPNLYVFNLE